MRKPQRVIIPDILRDIGSPHRDALERAFGPIQLSAESLPPEEDFLFLCFTNRCGSNYLAQLLASTGAFNEAGEFFNAATVLEHAAALRLNSLPAYFAALPGLVPRRRRIAAKAGVDQLVMLADAGILGALGVRARYVLLERRDRVGQAVSRVIAGQTGRWTTAHASDVPDSALVYHRGAIEAEIEKIARANAGFYLFFAANGIVPVHTTYEDMLARPQSVVDAVAVAMGLEGIEARPVEIGIERQAGPVNAEWKARYLQGG
jgi:trehalose 2-sulfotransferase